MQRDLHYTSGGSTGVAARKSALRSDALARRDATDAVERARWSAAIRESAAVLVPHRAAVTAFLPIRSEVDLGPLVRVLAAKGHAVGLPVISGTRLLFRAFTGEAALVPRGFGTVGPPDDAPIVEPDIMLVPLSVFDRRLNRIGYGKAYYDTTIAALRAAGRTPLLVGIAFSLQETDEVPVELHDVALDRVVTEREVILPPDA